MQRIGVVLVALGTIVGAKIPLNADAAAAGGGGPLYPWYTMFNRGDANADLRVDISDAVFTLQHLFLGGAAPTCQDAADANDDGELDLSDAVFTLVWLFRNGAEPPEPGTQGLDWDWTRGDPLGCQAYVDTQVRLIPQLSDRNAVPGQQHKEIATIFLQASEPQAAVLEHLNLTIVARSHVATPVSRLRLVNKETGGLLSGPRDADFRFIVGGAVGAVRFLSQIDISTVRKISIIGDLSPDLAEGDKIEVVVSLPDDASFTHRRAGHRVLAGPRDTMHGWVWIRHGRLDVQLDSTSPAAGTLVAEPDVWQTVGAWRFFAGPAAILITELYFDYSDYRVDRSVVGLFDDRGVLRQVKSLGNYRLHFDLDQATGLLVPENGFTTVTLKVQLTPITDVYRSGAWFRLGLDRRHNFGPIRAFNTVHGSELDTHDIGYAAETQAAPQIIRKTAPMVWRAGNPPFERLEGDDLALICPFRLEAHRNGDVAIKGAKVILQGQCNGAPLANLTADGFQTAVGTTVIPREFSLHEYDLDSRQVGAPIANDRYTVFYGWRENPGPAPGDTGGRCGNGTIETGEECDGAPNCTATCAFTEFGEVAFVLDDGVEEVVPAGVSRFYAIRLRLNGLKHPGDFVEVAFGFDRELDPNRVTEYPDGVDRWTDGQITMTAPVGYGGYALLWSDRSAVDHAAGNGFRRSSPDWTNDSYLEMDRTPWRLVRG